jgi:integrase
MYPLPPGPDGRRRIGTKTVQVSTKREALDELHKLTGSVSDGTHVSPSKQTMREYLADWLALYGSPPKTSLNTHRGYEGIIRRYLTPALGSYALRMLNADAIETMYAGLRGKGLSERTLLHVHVVLKAALTRAVRSKRLASNPAADVDAPVPPHREAVALDAEGVERAMQAVAESPYRDVFFVDVFTGLRRSEILGLRFSSVDLEARTIRIVSGLHRVTGQGLIELPTKTDKSRRRISIPDAVVDRLHSIRGRQIALAHEMGATWASDSFVFCRDDGRPFDPEKVSKDFSSRLTAAGLPGVTMHGLRHTMASLMLAEGEQIKVVQEQLGHGSSRITLDTYAHVMPGEDQAASDRLAKRLLG